MADTEKGSRERRTKLAENVDAVSDAADTVARWSGQQALTVAFILLLAFMCAGFGAQLWVSQEQAKARERESREALATLIREANAREELRQVHCAAEAERARKESTEVVKAVLAAAAAEGEKNRVLQREENAKFRAEFAAVLRGKGQP